MNKIVYHDFAPKAAEHAEFSADDSSIFEHTESLIKEGNPVNYATLENTGIDLLDTSLCFADSSDNVGFISQAVSGSDRKLPNGGVRLAFLLSGYYSGPGITLHFWQNTCPKVTVEFYRDTEQIFSGDFQPVSLDFYCEAPAERYNKLVLNFAESETPYQFVKLKGLDFGKTQEITEFFGSINIFEELSPDCTDLPYDTCDFEAIVPPEIKPQTGQSFYVYHGSQCFGKFTAENLSGDKGNRFVFEASDDKCVMGNCPFPILTNETRTVDDYISLIAENSDITIDNGGFGDTELIGFVKSNKLTSRYAAAMLSMGGGFFISSARNDKLRLFKARDRRDVTINADRILGEPDYKKNAPYTNIKLFVHDGSEFDNDTATVYPAKNETATANISVKELTLDKYSLFSDPESRLEEIKAIGFERNEIHAEIILDDEQIGDILNIETSQGVKTGIVKSLDINIQGSEVTAKIIIVETEVN